jgi:hypothetical protein
MPGASAQHIRPLLQSCNTARVVASALNESLLTAFLFVWWPVKAMMELIGDLPPVGNPHDAMARIEAALRHVRIALGARPETEIHAALAAALESGGIRVRREYWFASRCRAHR